MTKMQTPHRRRAVPAALALLIGLGLSAPALAPALAIEPLAPAAKSKSNHHKKWLKGDVTIIIIDEDDRSRSTVPRPELGVNAEKIPPAPSSRISRDDDDTTIIIKSTRTTGSKKHTGPKVIIVNKNGADGCSSGGVCVIRP